MLHTLEKPYSCMFLIKTSDFKKTWKESFACSFVKKVHRAFKGFIMEKNRMFVLSVRKKSVPQKSPSIIAQTRNITIAVRVLMLVTISTIRLLFTSMDQYMSLQITHLSKFFLAILAWIELFTLQERNHVLIHTNEKPIAGSVRRVLGKLLTLN